MKSPCLVFASPKGVFASFILNSMELLVFMNACMSHEKEQYAVRGTCASGGGGTGDARRKTEKYYQWPPPQRRRVAERIGEEVKNHSRRITKGAGYNGCIDEAG